MFRWRIIFVTSLALCGLAKAQAEPNSTIRLTATGQVGYWLGTQTRLKSRTAKPLVITSIDASTSDCKSRFSREPMFQEREAVATFMCRIYTRGQFRRSFRIHFSNGKSQAVMLAGEVSDSAKDCSDIRLDSPGGSMHGVAIQIPNVSQNGGSCSYHTAVQMYDAWRFHNSPEPLDLTSPLALDYEVKRSQKEKNLTGGNVVRNLKQLLKYGGCARKTYSKFDGEDRDEAKYDRLYEEFSEAKDFSKLVEFTERHFGQLPALSKGPGLEGLFRSFIQKNFIDFIAQLAPPTCSSISRNRTSIPYRVRERDFSVDIFGIEWHRSEPVKRNLHSELNKGLALAYPVGISYCSSVLDEGRSFQEISGPGDSNCGNHASLVIGRRKNPTTQKCEFLVRNSWSKYYQYNRAWTREPGTSNVWIDEDSLAQSVYSITVIEDLD